MNEFPVIVTLVVAVGDDPAGEVIDLCRLVYTPEGASCWEWDAAARTGRCVVATPKLETGDGGWRLLDADRNLVAVVVTGGGCGCGHPMRSWSPTAPLMVEALHPTV